LYACPVNASYQVPTIYKSTNGGTTWAATGGQPTTGWASGQGWYAMTIGIDPSNSNNCIVGGLDAYRTTTGGTSWS
jgi:trimeric autotransporter adhesin